MDFEVVENTSESFLSINRRETNGVKIAEIYWKEGDFTNLDYVVMFFSYNTMTQKSVSELIQEYRGKDANCIIGCVDIAGDVIDYINNTVYETFTALLKKFDLHLDAATESDFENLIEFCTSTETACPTINPYDFKSKQGTEIYIIAEEETSIDELKNQISSSCNKLFEHKENKFPKVMVCFLTNGYELRMDEVKEIMDSLADYITGDTCMMVLNNENEGQKADLIKVSLIFCEEGL